MGELRCHARSSPGGGVMRDEFWDELKRCKKEMMLAAADEIERLDRMAEPKPEDK